ncbi:MAG: transposase [Bacteroidota bacterium]|nr:transposase [Bacteroidota bacterium]
MLQDKDIAKIQEIKTLFTDSWIQPEFFSKQIGLFDFTKASKIFMAIKKSGVPAWDIIKLLLILPFSNVKSIHSLYNTEMAPEAKGQKDTYYRLLGNQKINWRNILLLFVKRYLKLDEKFSKPTDETRCLIFDDTEIAKTGKAIEGVSKIHSHVTQGFLFGFKLLVAGYWNGSVFIPVDFSFHRENKGNTKKKYGLSKKEHKTQKKTKRGKGLPVSRRFKELNSKKNDIVVQMFKRVAQRKIFVDYILLDSWFTTITLLAKFMVVDKCINIIGMYKYNSKVTIGGKERTIKQLRNSKKGIKRSRSTGFYNMGFIGEINGLTVKIFLTRKGKNGAWHTIISTDTSLSFNRMIKVYNIRWSIEVFFKEAKQLLGLGKSQSTNFDVQVAQTTITMIQYLLISLKYRMEAYETINGLFKDVKQDYIEHKLNERVMSVIIEILLVLDLLGVELDFEIIISNLICYSEKFSFLENAVDIPNICKLAA